MGKPIAVFLCTNLKKERTKSMRYDAAKERWMPMEVRGVRGYFNDLRIDRGTVPEGFHLRELADADNDGFPCRYRRGILVNFYGTFITKGQLPVDDPEWGAGYIDSAEEWNWLAERSITLEEIMKEEKGAA